MPTPGTKSRRRPAPLIIDARLGHWAKLESHANGAIAAIFDTDSISLGRFGAAANECLRQLRAGLPLTALTGANTDKEIELLTRRLASYGLLEFRIAQRKNGAGDLIAIEPQVRDYWPRMAELRDSDSLVLSRFAYIRRRGHDMVLESPRAGALFRILDARLAGFLATLSAPQQVKQLRQREEFPGIEILALLLDSQILFKTEVTGERDQRLGEGDHDLALWDFHDLLFHARSTEGRHANALGGVYPYRGIIPPLPDLRPSWPGKKIDLCSFLAPNDKEAVSPCVKLLRARHSTRNFDDRQPIKLAELSRFLDGAARAFFRESDGTDSSDGPMAARPYPSAGASYELELYLTVNNCEGLAQGFYHYDAGAHGLVPIIVPAKDVKALLMAAADAMGVTFAPQILITIAARFGRVSWKYSSIAYSLILKDVGVLMQTLYLMATGMGLGGCAIGIGNIDQFEKMTGIGFQVEGPVGQFALGRGATFPHER